MAARPYRIGVLGVHTSIDYPRSLFLGIRDMVLEAGHTLVSVDDLIPYHTLDNSMAHFRVSASIASRLDLDAVVFPVGCMAAMLRGDVTGALELLQVLDPSRTLIMERDLPGYRCVTKDGIPGMRACVRHLIEDRGFERIAFVSGPAQSRGAREREGIYFEEMAAHGLATPPELFARGDFGGDCADVIERVLDDNPDLQAICCACDLIAYTAYRVCRERGLAIGTDIAITGFDDHPRSRHLDPPLTTVHLTAYDFGCMAGREALRLCEGLPQEEHILESTFIARSSCGEGMRSDVEYFRQLLRVKPFPSDTFVSIMLDATLTMANTVDRAHFQACLETFLSKVRQAYLDHLSDPSEDDQLFSSNDLLELFGQGYRSDLSLEGFHNVAITLLEALHEESDATDANWVIEQISHLHLRIARMLNDAVQRATLDKEQREWVSFHIVDDALRMDKDPNQAYALMLEEFRKLGVDAVSLFLLPEPVKLMGERNLALSDVLKPIGTLWGGEVHVTNDGSSIVFQDLLDRFLGEGGGKETCAVGGLMAGNELMGVALLRPGALSIHAQMMAFLNTGSALKHLRMLATERELNQILNRNNLLLEHDSQHDEMTGLLNRRGFFNHIETVTPLNPGDEGAMLYLDLDGLKTINDTLGHDAGDEAIRETGRLLRSAVDGHGLVCRMGGDEFCALVMGAGDVVASVVDAIASAMRTFNETSGAPYRLNISHGAAPFVVEEATQPDIAKLMVEADGRLYRMKRAKKGLDRT